MSIVSRRKVSTKIESQINQTFWEAISKLTSTEEVVLFLNDLLSPTEKIVLAKRLAIAVLLNRGYGYESIMEIVKVSDGTIAKVAMVLKNDSGYKIAISKIAKSETSRAFWQDIESALYRISSPGKVFMDEGAINYKLGHKKKTLV